LYFSIEENTEIFEEIDQFLSAWNLNDQLKKEKFKKYDFNFEYKNLYESS